MPIQILTSASATVDVELDHHCPHCGTVSAALVRGKATTTERRTVLDLGGSDARFLAETDAQRNAALLIRLACCPACAKRDPAALRVLWMRGVWTLVGAAACYGIALASRDDNVPWHHGLGLTATVVLVIWLFFGLAAADQLKASRERVKFIAPAESQGPYRS